MCSEPPLPPPGRGSPSIGSVPSVLLVGPHLAVCPPDPSPALPGKPCPFLSHMHPLGMGCSGGDLCHGHIGRGGGCIPEQAAALMSAGKEGFPGPLSHLRVGDEGTVLFIPEPLCLDPGPLLWVQRAQRIVLLSA